MNQADIYSTALSKGAALPTEDKAREAIPAEREGSGPSYQEILMWGANPLTKLVMKTIEDNIMLHKESTVALTISGKPQEALKAAAAAITCEQTLSFIRSILTSVKAPDNNQP